MKLILLFLSSLLPEPGSFYQYRNTCTISFYITRMPPPDRLILGSVGFKGDSLVLAFGSGSAGSS